MATHINLGARYRICDYFIYFRLLRSFKDDDALGYEMMPLMRRQR